jgi:putative flippase GtrA
MSQGAARKLEWIKSITRAEKFQFLAIGAWNTIAGYLAFLMVNAWAGLYCPPVVVLILSYCISLPHAFITQRLWVFQKPGPWRWQFARFASANSFVFFVNLVFLPGAIAITGANPLLVQAVFVALSTFSSYFIHKHFSFAR